ncbi:hypothetical protein P5W98_02030 [Paraburkholderia sp. A1BS-2L]
MKICGSSGAVLRGHQHATSGPVKLTNVANASEASDAVNLAQLEAMGMTVDTSGNVTNALVAYDDTSKSSITLGGAGSNTPVAIHNVANGVTANDPVNVAQLQAMGAIVDSSGNVTNSLVAYDDATKGSVTFGGIGATAPTGQAAQRRCGRCHGCAVVRDERGSLEPEPGHSEHQHHRS